MVKIATSVLALAAFTSSALAVNCNTGSYCGKRLISENAATVAEIQAVLAGAGQPTNSQAVNESVFFCAPSGVPGLPPLTFVTNCGARTCQIGGPLGNGDACASSVTSIIS